MDIFSLSQESLWVITVVYDLSLALLLYRFFGKYGLYAAVVLGIVLGNLQGGKVRVHVRDGHVNINYAKVVQADVEASNGVVHLIDSVLLP